jgi:AcrR family transcriptional regulator
MSEKTYSTAKTTPLTTCDAEMTRQRILNIACQLFSSRGFSGVHIRELCTVAQVNNAAIAYHFGNKENLYNLVIKQAHQWMAASAGEVPVTASPRIRLCKLIERLCDRLSGDHSWVARILMIELLAPCRVTKHKMMFLGLGKELIQLEGIVRELVGTCDCRKLARNCAIAVVAQCVFWCVTSSCALAGDSKCHPAVEKATMARHIADVFLDGVAKEHS